MVPRRRRHCLENSIAEMEKRNTRKIVMVLFLGASTSISHFDLILGFRLFFGVFMLLLIFDVNKRGGSQIQLVVRKPMEF